MNNLNNTTKSRQEKENSKVFIRMGEVLGIKVTKESQRGIVAMKFLKKIEEVELREFALSMPNLLKQTPYLQANLH